MRTSLVMTAMLALSSVASAGPNLDIHQRTLEFTGAAMGELFTATGSTLVVVDVSPGMGYFVTDNVELHWGIGFGMTALDGNVSTNIRGWIGGDYLFGKEGPRPYVGAEYGAGDVQDPYLGVDGGVLVPLSSAVALDIGAQVNVIFGQGAIGVDVPAGVLGVRAFF